MTTEISFVAPRASLSVSRRSFNSFFIPFDKDGDRDLPGWGIEVIRGAVTAPDFVGKFAASVGTSGAFRPHAARDAEGVFEGTATFGTFWGLHELFSLFNVCG